MADQLIAERPARSIPPQRRPQPGERYPPKRRVDHSHWVDTALLFGLLAAALASLHVLLQGLDWWFAGAGIALLVLAAASAARSFSRRAWVPVLVGALAVPGLLTLFSAPREAILGVIPTAGVLEEWQRLALEGELGIVQQGIPADAVPGIVFLLAAAMAALAFAGDLLLHAARTPALVALPALPIYAVPVIVEPDSADAFFFLIGAVLYLLLLRSGRRGVNSRLAVATGSAVLVGALFVPFALPDVNRIDEPGEGDGLQLGVNPIIDLGDDLRRGDPQTALTYTTDATEGLYFKLTTLDDFTGREWRPVNPRAGAGNEVETIGAAPGLTEQVAREAVTTRVSMGEIAGRWLPVPYPPTSIDELDGNWFWEPVGLSIRTETSTIRGQDFEVSSLALRPTAEQLLASGEGPTANLGDVLEVPPDLPDVIAETAAQVTAGLGSDYERAVALQEFFTGGDFDYSEEAPVERGYDGTGADVIARFLDERSGYCVHFASAMAIMARTLDIPSRIAVGFQPGTPDFGTAEEATVFTVTTHDLHAWPELYFEGVGWTRFEPTPGRGDTPDYQAPAPDNPATPDVDESQQAPTPSAQPTTAPPVAPEEDEAAPEVSVQSVDLRPLVTTLAVVVGVVLLLLLPALVRVGRRARRLSRIRRRVDAARTAWREVLDTSRDLGTSPSPTLTVRVAASTLGQGWEGQDRAALLRVRDAVEAAAYSAGPRESASSSPGLDDAPPLVDDVRRVRAALGAAATRRQRVLAALLPASLLPARSGAETLERAFGSVSASPRSSAPGSSSPGSSASAGRDER